VIQDYAKAWVARYDSIMAAEKAAARAGPEAVMAAEALRNAEFDRNMKRFEVRIPSYVCATSSQLILVIVWLGWRR